jgi:propanol-preferring alcohol dehydrogenase
MKAAVLEEFSKPFAIKDMPIPVIDDDEVLLRVKACGLCGTDIKIWQGAKGGFSLPFIPGHEISGEIVDCGHNVKNIQKGDFGVVYFYISCGQCYFCGIDRETICSSIKGRIGHTINGGFAEYVKVPVQNFIPVPFEIAPSDICIVVDAIATPYHSFAKTDLRKDSWIGIVGLGGLGIHALQIAKLKGVNVIGVDISPERRNFARDFGADLLISPDEFENNSDKIRRLTGSGGIRTVLESAGTPESFTFSLGFVGDGGLILLNGYGMKDISMAPYSMISKEICLMGCRAATKNDVRAVVQLIKENKIKPVISKQYSLAEINEAFDEFKTGKYLGRQIIIP